MNTRAKGYILGAIAAATYESKARHVNNIGEKRVRLAWKRNSVEHIKMYLNAKNHIVS